jgi:transposase
MIKKSKFRININLDKAEKEVAKVKESIPVLVESNISKEIIGFIESLLKSYEYIVEQANLTSQNSSLSPSGDRKGSEGGDGASEGPNKRPSGGQIGHQGHRLQPVEKPDYIKKLEISKAVKGKNYEVVGYERRQVIEMKVTREVTEYVSEIIKREDGTVVMAEFPVGVEEAVQYGSTVRALAVTLTQKEMMASDRVRKFLKEHGLELSEGSLYNWIEKAYMLLLPFVISMRKKILSSEVSNVDETGSRVNGKNWWLHTFSTVKYVLLYFHPARGQKALEDINLIPQYLGTLVHDGWKSYFKYGCKHSLCNAHHLRELRWCVEHKYEWANLMSRHLSLMKKETEKELKNREIKELMARYMDILADGEKEIGEVDSFVTNKAMNLLKRLREYMEETTRFLKEVEVPFTNNLAERDIRMTKVKQKVSGCFRSENGAKHYARITSYLKTCERFEIGASEALMALFEGKLSEILQRLELVAE